MAFSPSVGAIQVPISIQNLTIQYKPRDLIGEQVWPIVPVAAPQVKVLKYTKANLFRLQDADLIRNEGSPAKRFTYDVASQSLAPKQIACEVPVTDELLDVSSMPGQLPLQPLVDAVQLAVTKIDQYKEYTIANSIYGNTWADGTAGGFSKAGVWSSTTAATNTFITDVFAAKDTIRQSAGIIPNTLVMDYTTFIAQQSNPNVSDKIKYTQLSVTTAGLLAELLQLDEVLVGRDIIITSPPNKLSTTVTSSSVWSPSGKGNAFLFVKSAPGLRVLSAGFQFRLPYLGAMRYIKGYRDEITGSTVYRVIEQVDISPVALDVGYAWSHTNAA